ncbi:MAG: helix-turn-helix transcriptional regulator [Clostridia bacterium]|nr:helix-turn-helix transcriptional regulator [Clostridia bacterium]
MPIIYDKLFKLLKDNGYTTYKIRQDKLIGQGTLTALKNGTGGLDRKTLSRLCEKFDCQPADLMEYVKDSDVHEKG